MRLCLRLLLSLFYENIELLNLVVNCHINFLISNRTFINEKKIYKHLSDDGNAFIS